MNKKILLLGISFHDAIGGGVTLKNLSSQFKPEQIGIADFSLSSNDYKYAKSIFNLRTNSQVECIPLLTEAEIESAGRKNRALFKKFMSGKTFIFFLYVRKYFSYYYNNFFNVVISDKLIEFIHGFKPDYIYIVPYNRMIIRFAYKINSLTNAPIVTHFMDDFSKRSPHDLFYPINECLTKLSVKKIIQKSYKCLAICESMADEYEQMFHKKFYSFHNPINIDLFRNYTYQKDGNYGKIKILYIGTIAQNNFETLSIFSSICEQIGKENQTIHFDIFAPEMKNNIFYKKLYKNICNYKYVNLQKSIGHDKIIPLMYNYDMLFLPLTFKKKYYNVIKVSFPTKVAEYMASGIPSLYVVPPKIALHKYLIEHKFGTLIDQLDYKLIKDFLLSFIHNPGLRVEDARARDIAFKNFHIADVALKFKTIFS